MKVGLVRVWLRLLTVQASWNYDRLVGVGIGFALEPILRSLPGGPAGERYKDAMRRAARYFNAHPYFTAAAVGALGRAEHEGLPGEQIERLRQALVGPLGSLGDRLVWAGVLPASTGIGLVLAATVSPVVGALTFLGLYNAAHFWLRVWTLRVGWLEGVAVSRALKRPIIQAALRLAGPAAGLAAGVALPIVAGWLVQDLAWSGRITVGAVAVLGLVLARWVVPVLGGLRFGLVMLVVALLVGWLWS